MDIRDATYDDLDAILDVRRRSFGPESANQPESWRALARRAIDDRSFLVATDNGTVLASARLRHFSQWWSGRSIPMAGIGAVVVAPEARGGGTARTIMTAILDRCHELGFPLTALYPATPAPYRAVGYELGGVRQMIEVPADTLRRLEAPRLDVRRAVPGDEELLNRLTGEAYAAQRSDGPFEIAPYEWTRDLENTDLFTYIAEDGFVSYRFSRRGLLIEAMSATSRDTMLGLWRLVGSGSSIAKSVRANVGPHDPVHWLAPRQIELVEQDRFMLRLVDAPAAVAGRGFPDGIEVEVPLRLKDDELPGNAGDVVLRVADGRGELVLGTGPDPLDLGARGLAALYAGIPLATLRLLNLATGGSPADDERLDTVFGAEAFMVIDF